MLSDFCLQQFRYKIHATHEFIRKPEKLASESLKMLHLQEGRRILENPVLISIDKKYNEI